MLTILFIDNIFLSLSDVCVFYCWLFIICCFTVQKDIWNFYLNIHFLFDI